MKIIINKLNNFFEKTHLFKVWLIVYLILILFISSLCYTLHYFLQEFTFINKYNYLKFGILIGMIFSWIIILAISITRKSIIFWNYAKYFEELVNKATTKEELEKIWCNEYNELINKCQGGNQLGEVKKLIAIIKTKYKFVK